MIIQFKVFKSSFSSWDTLLSEAAEFANGLQPDRLINISHSADQNQGVVVVWYWAERSESQSS